MITPRQFRRVLPNAPVERRDAPRCAALSTGRVCRTGTRSADGKTTTNTKGNTQRLRSSPVLSLPRAQQAHSSTYKPGTQRLKVRSGNGRTAELVKADKGDVRRKCSNLSVPANGGSDQQ